MAAIREMLDTHPRPPAVDPGVLERTIQALLECANTCTQCADACLGEEDPAPLVRCIRLNLDCADVCETTARVLSRQTEWDPALARSLLEACARFCAACGEECRHHAGHMEHCRVCADACRRCEEACRELLQALA